MSDVETSTSRPLFEYDKSVLSVWVNHVILHKGKKGKGKVIPLQALCCPEGG